MTRMFAAFGQPIFWSCISGCDECGSDERGSDECGRATHFIVVLRSTPVRSGLLEVNW